MSSAHLLRLQIEAALSDRIPSALTPAPRVIRPTASTGISALDDRLGGGLPIGAISELTGPECSGRTSLALSLIAGMTQAGRVCAWVDVSDAMHPESAAAIGVDLERLLWVRCGPELRTPGPRQLALPGLLETTSDPSAGKQPSVEARQNFAPRCAEPQPTLRKKSREVVASSLREQPASPLPVCKAAAAGQRPVAIRKDPWSRLDQALRATDLLLQAGGFSVIVLDMGSLAPKYALRVPLATWFRYRAAAERTQVSVVLLTQHACAKSSAGLVLYCEPGPISAEGSTILTGAEYRVEVTRARFAQVMDWARKPPQSERNGSPLHASGSPIRWQSRTPWAGRR